MVILTPEQVLAALMTKIQLTANNDGCKDTNCVISIPGWWPQFQRCRLLDALTISQLQCYRIIPHLTATGLQYGLFRRKDLKDSNRHVLFIDVGASHTSMGVLFFKPDEILIINQEHISNLGGRDFDEVLFT